MLIARLNNFTQKPNKNFYPLIKLKESICVTRQHIRSLTPIFDWLRTPWFNFTSLLENSCQYGCLFERWFYKHGPTWPHYGPFTWINFCIQGQIIASADNLNHPENNQLKGDVSLTPSSTHIGCEMAVIHRVDMDQTTTVQSLFNKLDLKSKQGFEGTEKQEGTIVSYSWFSFVLAIVSQQPRGWESEAANGFVHQDSIEMALSKILDE